jgi:hypothetical protein
MNCLALGIFLADASWEMFQNPLLSINKSPENGTSNEKQ